MPSCQLARKTGTHERYVRPMSFPKNRRWCWPMPKGLRSSHPPSMSSRAYGWMRTRSRTHFVAAKALVGRAPPSPVLRYRGVLPLRLQGQSDYQLDSSPGWIERKLKVGAKVARRGLRPRCVHYHYGAGIPRVDFHWLHAHGKSIEIACGRAQEPA